jgi:hypothetical protein
MFFFAALGAEESISLPTICCRACHHVVNPAENDQIIQSVSDGA